MTEHKKYEQIAFEKGYRLVGEDIIGPRGHALKLHLSTKYKCFKIKLGKRVVRVKVHRFIAYLKFTQDLYEPGIVVRHLDGNPLNNNEKNLALGSYSDNAMDIPPEQRRKNASNPKHNHKLILEDREKGLSYIQIMKKHGITSKGTISFIVNKSMVS